MKSISLYIHIPFCLSKCTYCDFFSKPQPCSKSPVPDDYVSALCSELKYRLGQIKDKTVSTIYIGGGTPSLLNENQIEKISGTIKQFPLSEDPEFTFELNPDDINEQLLKALWKNGITRLSVGVQSFSDTVLKSIQRRADSACIYSALDCIKAFWPGKMSADLICGLPYETEETMLKALQNLINYEIPHISFYSLCVEEETPLGKQITNGLVPYDQDFCDDLWIKGRDFLLQNGYEQYEISNFCKTENECRHNMTYWTHKDYIGAGAGACGTIYNQDGTGIRLNNTKDINAYIQFWNNLTENPEPDIPQEKEILELQTSIFEYFMMGLRTKNGVSPQEYKDIFGSPMPEKIINVFRKWEQKGLCICKERYALNEKGMLFLNNILQEIARTE